MKRSSFSQSAFFHPRMLLAVAFCATGLFLALIGLGAFSNVSASAPNRRQELKPGIIVISSYHDDVSAPLRDMALLPAARPREDEKERRREDNLNPKLPFHHVDKPDPVIQQKAWIASLVPQMPGTILNFAGIPYPGVGCSCSPPDINGEVGATQYVQMVNEGYQVFNKSNGASVLGPASIVSLWSGFGGACQTGGFGDPVVLYDQLANRWIITQFASATGGTPITDQCIAVSTTSDATGTYNRYGYHLGSNFFDYPHLGVWPDGYYMSMNVFNSAGTAFLGPQAFAFDRAAMLAGTPATIVTPGITGGPTEDSFLPGDLDGSTLPPPGAPNTFVEFPGTGTYRVFHFHADFVTPANTTFTLFASPAAAGFTELCAATRSCVPQGGTAVRLDGIGDRLMFRLPYRKFPDGHESMVGNYTVSAGGVSGVRWFELRNVTAGPVTVFQESTFQPADGLWRWMGSAAMDGDGNLAIGYSTSSASAFPGIRYAGRLVGEPLNTLGQGEATLISGGGSQTSTGDRWGDYSDMTIDPVDDHTFWYTNEYYIATASVNWQTRIANFKFITAPNLLSAGGSSIDAAGPNGVPDPGEYVTVTLGVQNIGTGGCTTAALNGTLQVSGGVTSPSPAAQNYGVVCTGGGAVSRTFTFKVDPALACGAPITASLALLDGAIDYGTLTYTLSTGTPAVSFSENFDGVVAPALPAGWTTAHTGSELDWVTSTTNPSSAPNAAFAPDPTTVGNTELVTPSIPIPAGGGQLTFRNLYNMESSGGNFYDGMVLEISINGGAFADIITAGGSFVAGGYVGTISSSFSSPISGRQAWSGLSGGTTTTPAYITTTVNLPAAAGGQSIKLKWRAATDSSVAAAGQAGVRVDSISLNTLVCAPVAQDAKSRKFHPGVGPFSVDLPLFGNVGVECRDGGVTHDLELVVNFAGAVTMSASPQAEVLSGTATVGTGGVANGGAVTITGSEVSVPLTNVANAQVVTVRLNNVNTGGRLGGVAVSFATLLGDVNGDTYATHVVNSSDVSQVQFESGNPVGLGNFRSDITVSGDINSSDVSAAQTASGTGF